MNSDAKTPRPAPVIPFNPRGALRHIDFVTRIQPTIIFVNPDQNPDSLSSWRFTRGSQPVGGNWSRADRTFLFVPDLARIFRSRNDTAPTNKHQACGCVYETCTHQRTPSETAVHLEVCDVPLVRPPERDESGAPDNALHFRHERARRHPTEVLPRRTCVPIHYPNWLIEISRHWRGTDGYSFVQSGTHSRRENSLVRSRSVPTDIYLRTYACRTEEQPFRRGSRKLAI